MLPDGTLVVPISDETPSEPELPEIDEENESGQEEESSDDGGAGDRRRPVGAAATSANGAGGVYHQQRHGVRRPDSSRTSRVGTVSSAGGQGRRSRGQKFKVFFL